MKKAIQIQGAPAPIGPYSQAIVKNNTIYVSGQIPLDPFSGKLIVDSIEKATIQVLTNISNVLKEAGFSMNDIVKCTVFMKDLSLFPEMNAIYATYFSEIPPARETVEVSKLPMDVPIEISCIAVQ